MRFMIDIFTFVQFCSVLHSFYIFIVFTYESNMPINYIYKGLIKLIKLTK